MKKTIYLLQLMINIKYSILNNGLFVKILYTRPINLKWFKIIYTIIEFGTFFRKSNKKRRELSFL
jgi:hypothetical protein